MTDSAGSPCSKITSFFLCVEMMRPLAAVCKNVAGSNDDAAAILRRVLVILALNLGVRDITVFPPYFRWEHDRLSVTNAWRRTAAGDEPVYATRHSGVYIHAEFIPPRPRPFHQTSSDRDRPAPVR